MLDVRKKSEYENGHIKDALNIAHTRLLPRKDDLPGDQTLAIHCAAGGRSAYAASYLKSAGFSVKWVYDNFENAEEIYDIEK